jgi:hypothetical protein
VIFLQQHGASSAVPPTGGAGRGLEISAAAPSDDLAAIPPPPRVRALRDFDSDGLALADANRGPDGILLAREIAGLDLRGTQLVVLSACETGVGVFGMRRAVALAGAAAQVVSLWRTDDAATRELMRSFYRRLADGAGRAEALRQAKLDLVHQPASEHPYFWAAFLHAGDWTAMPPGAIRSPRAP